jgi:hypothetical protein
MVTKFKGLTPEQKRLLAEGTPRGSEPSDQGELVKEAFLKAGFKTLVAGKFIMINIHDAKRLLAKLGIPMEELSVGSWLKLVANTTETNKEE